MRERIYAMNNNFVQPRFTGSRFNDHMLPVDAARDLAAYEILLIELANHLFLRDHPERQRVPKGFSNAHLAIVSVEEGSAKPVLALVTATLLPMQLMLIERENLYFSLARDLIAECIAAQDTSLPKDFPKELLSHFNQLGRSLQEGEALELPRQNTAQTAVLNSEKRRKLVLTANAVYERDIELAGFIGEADWEKATFRLRLDDGSSVIVPMPENFRDKIRQSGGRSRDYVFVKGVATYDSGERFQRIITVDSLEVIKNYPLATRFDDLAQLEAGWYEGQGEVPDKEKLHSIAQRMIDFYPDDFPLPNIVPTQEGNLLLEWITVGDPSVDIDLGCMKAGFHAFGTQAEDVEKEFILETNEDFNLLFSFLSKYIQQREL
jgi:hypothetical protein